MALEDDLLRIFGGERITSIMERLGMDDGEPIEHGLISRAIENAQAKVEAHNFDIRKQLLEYDDVMNQQREVIYKQRREALIGKDLQDSIKDMIDDKIFELVDMIADEKVHPEEWDYELLDKLVFEQFNFYVSGISGEPINGLQKEGIRERINDFALKVYHNKQAVVEEEDFRRLERIVMLQTVDNLWKDHLLSMDHLKEGIGLRGYAQQNPLIVYKKEGFEMFQDMISRVKKEVLEILFRIQVEKRESIETLSRPKEQELVFSGSNAGAEKKKPVQRASMKIGRNDPCSCGSGKKYKKCCGQ
jgi:preprotein translocase subunit SecA